MGCGATKQAESPEEEAARKQAEEEAEKKRLEEEAARKQAEEEAEKKRLEEEAARKQAEEEAQHWHAEEPEWDEEVSSAAEKMIKAMEDGEALDPSNLAEFRQILKSRLVCKLPQCPYAGHPPPESESNMTNVVNDLGDGPACRFAHPKSFGCDEPLWDQRFEADLSSPSSTKVQPFRREQLAWGLFRSSYRALGSQGFLIACLRQTAAVEHHNSREGARIVGRGLPEPDELQSFALNLVKNIWGEEVVSQENSQEYLDRSGNLVQSRLTESMYSPPSRSTVKVGGGPKDSCRIARIIKVGIKNDLADLRKETQRDTAWHGLSALGLPKWKESGPRFRADLAKRTAHGGSVYCTPAFEHAIAYSFRGAVSPVPGSCPFAAMTTSLGERWNYIAIMQLAIYDRGTAGVVEEKHQTFGAAPDDGWDRSKIEWVVHDVTKAQIYGVLFCFFPDDQNWGAGQC
eukprot:TRINITY_DN1332_c0_g1_i1.p1 TRINITY_DN1332_c0_g1~~TRINITY_DN1332_c0_g1_i1.p1  ORF type:complete len:459 (+),score=90.46 TRINITY_DN1332_c0_g1_i1:21-1397(+)